jgi:hypothetical protein
LRAVGALLLELPGLLPRLQKRRSNVFRLAYRQRKAEDAWKYFQNAPKRRGRTVEDLWREVGVSDDELRAAVLA